MTTFRWQELQDAIVDYDTPLGAGSYGTVYRGRLRGGTDAAIKVLNMHSQQGHKKFDREVDILGGLHHEHLLPLLGSCSERHALVCPLMQGSLQHRLHLAPPAAPTAAHAGVLRSAASESPAPLPYLERVRICNEVVKGLIWLHSQEPPILHMDLKTANVLLDRFGTAKVGDVGLAKLKSGSVDTASYMQSSALRGTPAYMAPEYLQRGQCGSFTDVYALGVIMCELLTGTAAMDAAAALEEVFANPSTNNAEQANAALQPLLDPAAHWPTAVAVEFARMAAACLQSGAFFRRRPDVQRDLQPALEKMLAAAATAAGPSIASAQQGRSAGQQQVAAEHQALPAAPFDPDSSLMKTVKCSICHDTMTDPVSTPRGITFCRPCITRWLDSDTTCPITRQPLSVQQLVPNRALAGLLEKMGRMQLQQQQQAAAAQQMQQQQQQQETLPGPSARTAAQSRATACQAPSPAAAMPFTPAQPDPSELLQAAKDSPNDALAWQAFGRSIQGCTAINLSKQGLGDAHWPALAQHAAQYWRSLQSLYLGHSEIGAAGVTFLSQAAQHWPNLQSLDLRSNSIGDAGVTALVQAARHWPNLQRLSLYNNSIGDAGVTALVQAARHWPNLQRLSLGSNSIGFVGATALARHAAQHWPSLHTLDLCNNIGDAGVIALVQAAQHWPNMQRLGLANASIGVAGVTALVQAAPHWPNLQNLILSRNSIGAAGVTALAQAAPQWPNLQYLILSRNSIGDAGVTARAQAARHRPNLQHLYLGSNSIGDAGVTALAQAARHWPNLQSLNLSNDSIGDAGATALAQAARHWPNLQSLNLSNDGIGAAGVTALAQAARHWPNLQHLYLGSNSIGDAGAAALAQAARHWPNLQHLYLSNDGIGDAGVTALAQAARHWPHLLTLILSANSIGAAGVTALAQAAQHWPNLQHLDLNNNGIGAAGVTALAQAARHWPNLQSLGLGGNIGDAGVTALVQAARHWPHRQGLNLSPNSIGGPRHHQHECCLSLAQSQTRSMTAPYGITVWVAAVPCCLIATITAPAGQHNWPADCACDWKLCGAMLTDILHQVLRALCSTAVICTQQGLPDLNLTLVTCKVINVAGMI